MKKFILIALSMCFALLPGTEGYCFYYGDIHAMSGYPMTGFGVRAQRGIHAFDISANIPLFNPLKSLELFHLKGCYLFYPKGKGLYFGGGLGLLNEPETLKSVSGSFEGVLGYQWCVGRNHPIFLEANTTIAFHKPEGKVGRIWPGVTVGLGF